MGISRIIFLAASNGSVRCPLAWSLDASAVVIQPGSGILGGPRPEICDGGPGKIRKVKVERKKSGSVKMGCGDGILTEGLLPGWFLQNVTGGWCQKTLVEIIFAWHPSTELDGDTQISNSNTVLLRARESILSPRKQGESGSEWLHLRTAFVAQEHHCLGLDGYLYTAGGEQGEEIWVVLRSDFWWLTMHVN
jgi:hypothetical protein